MDQTDIMRNVRKIWGGHVYSLNYLFRDLDRIYFKNVQFYNKNNSTYMYTYVYILF